MELFKENTWKVAAVIIGIVITIATSAVTFNHTYAKAEDVKSLVRNQDAQIQYLQKQQTSQQLFQLEYYEDRIKQLERQRNFNNAALIDREISDIKTKKEYLYRSMVR